MSQKLDNARNLYLHGIAEGHIDAVDDYTGSRYTQHSTGVADGTEGFKEFFRGFLERTNDRDIRLIRAIEDGRYVFVHAYQNIDNGSAQWITTDLFDTDDNDKIVEHWDVIAAYQAPDKTVSGNDMILGDFELKDLNKTEDNKALVRSYLVDVFQNANHSAIDNYLCTSSYTEHNPTRANGIESVRQLLAENIHYDFVFNVIGQGDHVVSYSKVTHNGAELAVFDIFRLENTKIVEHWDNSEPIPPRSEWANTGKF